MNLSELSRTAILALICRVVESEKKNSVFNDPMAVGVCRKVDVHSIRRGKVPHYEAEKKCMQAYRHGTQKRAL